MEPGACRRVRLRLRALLRGALGRDHQDPLSQYFGLAIGNVSGGSLNPAVSTDISAAQIIGGGHFYNCLIYSAAEIAGAAVASGVFYITRHGGVSSP